MILTVFTKTNALISIPLEEYDLKDVIFGTDSIKEIAFFRYLSNEKKCTMEKLYNQLKFLKEPQNSDTIYTVQIAYSNDFIFSFTGKIKSIFYNISSYMERKELKTQERLVIRFSEDNKNEIDFDEKAVICSLSCPYLSDGDCLKYKSSLTSLQTDKFLVCKNCFLEMSKETDLRIQNSVYGNMITDYRNNILKDTKYH